MTTSEIDLATLTPSPDDRWDTSSPWLPRSGAEAARETRSRMPILFNLTRLVSRALIPTPTGIDRVEMAYARHLLAHFPDTVQFAYSWRAVPRIIPKLLAQRFVNETEQLWAASWSETADRDLRRLNRVIGLDVGPEFGKEQKRLKRRKLPVASRLMARALLRSRSASERTLPPESGGIYLNVSHEGTDRIQLRRWLERNRRWRAIYLVHDTIPVTHPEYSRPGSDRRHFRRLRNMTATATSLIANTEYTRDDLIRTLGPEFPRGLAVNVAPLGVEDVFRRAKAERSIGTPYFVCLGTIEPRKNHILLLNIWRRIVEEMGPSAPKLVVVGRRGWENENVIDLLERCEQLKGHVIECGQLPDVLLAELIAHAQAVLFPSFVEGYGLPVVEAMALGTPVLCSDITVFREVGCGIPERLDPLDGLAWIQAVRDYTKPDSPRRQTQLDLLAHFRPPTWDDHFSVLHRAIERLDRT